MCVRQHPGCANFSSVESDAHPLLSGTACIAVLFVVGSFQDPTFTNPVANLLPGKPKKVSTDPQKTGVQVEKKYIDIIREVSSSISIPVSVKAGPFFSSIPNMCLNMVNAGAKGLVLFNKFYQPDFDIEEFEVNPKLKLSRSYDMRLPMRWVAIMYDQIPIDFAITSGVHTYKDVIKSILAGASVTMMASVLLSDGIDRIGGMLEEIENWMIEKNYNSISQMKGRMSQGNIGEPAAFERANYMKVLQSWRQDPTGPKIY
jgi:dihydroorotate dehydrogenase (fumarate)